MKARYLVSRLVRGVLTLVTLVTVTFILYFSLEGNPPLQVFFRGPTYTPQQRQEVKHLFFLDESKPRLIVHYLAGLAHADLGHARTFDLERQVVDAGPVAPFVTPAFRATLSILLGGATLVLLFALPLGAISGSRIGSWADRLISFLALVLVCTHPMMLGLMLQSADKSVNWLPSNGYCPLLRGPADTCGGVVDWTSHLVLPWLTFALLFLALYTRMVRASVAETIHEDFVRTARAKGASQARVLTRHVLPSAALRVLTMVGMEIGTAIGVCLYIETAFGINGLGRLAVFQLGGSASTLNLMEDLAIVVLITLVVVVGNLVVDTLYTVLDPRIGALGAGTRTKSLVGGIF